MIDAATTSIAENGVAATTVARVVRSSGVTWGGIQHHFPTKEALQQAVVEDALGRLRKQVRAHQRPGAALEDRVRGLVRGWWQAAQQPHFRAYVEIVIHTRGPDRPGPLVPHVQDLLRDIWMDVFGDLDIPQERSGLAVRMLFSSMAGLAIDRMMVPEIPGRSRVLSRLTTSLIRVLEGEPDPNAGSFGPEDD